MGIKIRGLFVSFRLLLFWNCEGKIEKVLIYKYKCMFFLYALYVIFIVINLYFYSFLYNYNFIFISIGI